MLFALLGGILLALAWLDVPFCWVLFGAWLPFLWLEQRTESQKFWKFWLPTCVMMLLWNALSTWWIWNASPAGCIMAIVGNSLLMTIPLSVYRWAKKITTIKLAQLVLVAAWISFEYFHFNWELNWPWLALGNAFGITPSWVQWYEYTGVLGGTLWVWVVNILLWRAYQGWATLKGKEMLAYSIFWVAAPTIWSLTIYYSYEEKGKNTEIVVVQPNIDPYTEKFVGTENYIPVEEQLQRMLALAAQKITPSTEWLLFPETAIDATLRENDIENEKLIQQLRTFLRQYPHLSLITGTTSYLIYDPENPPFNSRYREDVGYYDYFNTALYLQHEQPIAIYHKSRLVPGVEGIPYQHALSWLGALVIDLGGASGSLGKQAERSVFSNKDSTATAAPVICYESVFGEFCAEYIQKRANFIAVITNDGWWGNTAGHRQHLRFSSLRAIELRRSIARSANTGISCFVNQRGDILQPTEYWQPAVLKADLQLNTEMTFYAAYGDYLGRIIAFLLVFVLISIAVKKKTTIQFKPRVRK
jgi:apolipoprotein N-acyltransferase